MAGILAFLFMEYPPRKKSLNWYIFLFCVFACYTFFMRFVFNQASCPAGWESWTDPDSGIEKCFIWLENPRSYRGAKDFCLSHGAIIAGVKSSKKRTYLLSKLSTMKSTAGVAEMTLWLGADIYGPLENTIQFFADVNDGYDPNHWYNYVNGSRMGYWSE